MGQIFGLNATSQALSRNQINMQRTAANIAHAPVEDKLPDTKDCADLVKNRMEAEVLSKTISIQNKCADSLLDLFA